MRIRGRAVANPKYPGRIRSTDPYEHPSARLRGDTDRGGNLHERPPFGLRLHSSLPRTADAVKETSLQDSILCAGRTKDRRANEVPLSIPAGRGSCGRRVSHDVRRGPIQRPIPAHVCGIEREFGAFSQHHVPDAFARPSRYGFRASRRDEARCARTSRRIAGVRPYTRSLEADLGLGHVDVHFAGQLPEPLYPMGHGGVR